MQRRTLFLLILIFGLSYWGYLVYSHQNFETNYEAHDFSLKDQKGNEVFNFSDTKGKVVLLHFWASWCPPCVDEIPSLNKIYQTFDHNEFEIIALSFDNSSREMKEFSKKMNIQFPVYWDEDQRVGNQYGTFRLPETYIIDKQGIVVDKAVGPQNWENVIWKTRIYDLIQAK